MPTLVQLQLSFSIVGTIVKRENVCKCSTVASDL